MSTEDRYTRITLRIPKDLHGILSQAADDTSKSMNAEIIARLEDSVLRDTPADELVSASKAKELAALARQDLSEAIRKEVILDLRSAISRGMSVSFVDLSDYGLEEMGNAEFAEVVGGIEAELIEAGYCIEWDGQETLTVAFDASTPAPAVEQTFLGTKRGEEGNVPTKAAKSNELRPTSKRVIKP